MRALLLAVSVLLATPAVSQAAYIYRQDGSSHVDPELRLLADPGESNVVTVNPDGGGYVRVTDTGAPLRPSADCVALTPNAVRCPSSPIDANLEDGDDAIHLGETPGVVFGGSGDDRIHGSIVGDLLSGGDGADVIEGAEGDDEVAGDGLTPGADRLSGGPGSDSLSYSGHSLGVTVTLSQDPVRIGSAGEDVAGGFENVAGSPHDDLLIGDAGPNRIDAGAGPADRVEARGGDDWVNIPQGSAHLGSGDDVAFASPRTTALDCGPGGDLINGSRLFGTLSPDCETWTTFVGTRSLRLSMPIALKLTGRRAAVNVPCPRYRERTRCFGTIALKLPPHGRELGRRSVAARGGKTATAAFALSDRELAQTREAAGLGLCVHLHLTYTRAGRPTWDGYCTTLRAPEQPHPRELVEVLPHIEGKARPVRRVRGRSARRCRCRSR